MGPARPRSIPGWNRLPEGAGTPALVANGDAMTTNGTDLDEIIVNGTGPTVPPRHLTVPEASARVGLSQRAIRRALHEGRLSGVSIAGRWVIGQDDLDDYARMARRHRAKGAAEPTERHGELPGLDELARAVESVLDRAVAAEARAARAEATLAQIEAGTASAQEEADALRARVVELEQQLARRRRWWPWGSTTTAEAA